MEEDRLSALPNELITRILSLLPIDSAIRTGTLSKRWLDCWKYIDVIHFQETRVKSERYPFSQPRVKMEYHVVDDCIRLIRSPKISKFIIVGSFVPLSESDIESWVEFSITKQVQSMEFYMIVDPESEFFDDTFEWRGPYFELPDMFYIKKYTESMEKIALTCVDFRPPPSLGFSGVASLKSLFLFECKVNEEALESIMSNCSVLESLSIIRCNGHENLKISSRSLKEFLFVNHPYVYDVRRVEIVAPNLISVKGYDLVKFITRVDGTTHPSEVRLIEWVYCDSFYDGLLSNVVGNLENLLLNAKVLGTNSLLFLELITNNKLGVDLEEFNFVDFWFSKEEMMIILHFLGKCSSLKKIQMEFDIVDNHGLMNPKMFPVYPYNYEKGWPMDPPSWAIEMDDVQNAPTLQQVTTIEFFCYSDIIYEVEVMKLLLQITPNLKSVILSFGEPEHHALCKPKFSTPICMQERIRQEVSLLPRASPDVEFVIN